MMDFLKFASETDEKLCNVCRALFVYWQCAETYFAREEGIYVTFFTSYEANAVDNKEELLRRETALGHSVQNHSYSHQYFGNVYSSLESFAEQILLPPEG